VIDLLKDYFEIILYGHVARKGKWQSPDTGDAVPNLFGLLGVAEGKDTLGRVDAQTKEAADLGGYQTYFAAREPESAADADIRGSAMDRRRNTGLARPARRLGRHVEDTATCKLSSRILTINGEASLTTRSFVSIRLVSNRPTKCCRPLVGIGDDLTPIKRLIIKQAKGNPFFIEESVQMLLDERTLVTNGSIKLTKVGQ